MALLIVQARDEELNDLLHGQTVALTITKAKHAALTAVSHGRIRVMPGRRIPTAPSTSAHPRMRRNATPICSLMMGRRSAGGEMSIQPCAANTAASAWRSPSSPK